VKKLEESPEWSIMCTDPVCTSISRK